jgi:HSP20 family protein
MALIRWEPVRELGTIQDEMNRLFNTFFDTPTGAAPQRQAMRWMPAMDLVEDEGEYILHADLPGVAESDVSIELEDSVLTISGERKTKHEERRQGYRRIERGFGSFRRSLTLPEGVDPQSIKASFDRGVLEVRIPKPAQQTPHKVRINLGGEQQAAIEGQESASSSDNSASAEKPEPAVA